MAKLLDEYQKGLLRPSFINISDGIVPDYAWMRTSLGASFPMISNRLPPRVMQSAYGQYKSLAMQEIKQIQLMHEKRYDYSWAMNTYLSVIMGRRSGMSYALKNARFMHLHDKQCIPDLIDFDYQKVIKHTNGERRFKEVLRLYA